MSTLQLSMDLPIRSANGGLFQSSGVGQHPTRQIESYELIFVQQGTLGMFEEAVTFDMNAGDTLLLHPGRVHGGTCAYPPDLSFFWIHFYCMPTRRKKKDAITIPQTASLIEPERLTGLYRRFLHDQEEGRLSPEQGALWIMLMLAEVAQVANRPSITQVAPLAQRAHAYIQTHARDNIHTASIAQELECNPDYLGRIYARAYGHSLTEGIHRRRLQIARSLLTESCQSLKQIAAACGYATPGYFRRTFRALEGMTPSTYRRLYTRIHMNTE